MLPCDTPTFVVFLDCTIAKPLSEVTSSQVRAATPKSIVFMHKKYSQELWDKGEAEGHVNKNAFQDRHGNWHYKELSLVELTIRQYCTDNGLILVA